MSIRQHALCTGRRKARWRSAAVIRPRFSHLFYLGATALIAASCSTPQRQASPTPSLIPTIDQGLPSPSPSSTKSPIPLPVQQAPTIDPTLAGIPTARFAPTRTPEPTPIPPSTPTLQVQADLDLEGVFTYIDQLDILHILGEVENQGDEHQVVAVGAALYDRDGNILDQIPGLTAVEVVPADGRSPFEILVERPQGYADFRVIVEGFASDREPRTDLQILELEEPTGSRFQIRGRVLNPGSALMEYAQAIATLYDAQNRVIGIGMEFIQPEELGQGASAPFEIILDQTTSDPDHYAVFALGF